MDNLTFLFGHRDPDVQPQYHYTDDSRRHEHMLPGHNEYRRNPQHRHRQGPRNPTSTNHISHRNTTDGPGRKKFIPWVSVDTRYPELKTVVEVMVYTSPTNHFRLPRAYHDGGIWINQDTGNSVGGDVKFWRHRSKIAQSKIPQSKT